jgi:hypothetical protein
MRRRSKRSKKNAISEYILGTLAILVSLAIAGGAAYFFLIVKAPELNQSLCPQNGPKGQYVILLDKTDPLTFTQTEALKTFMLNTARQTPIGYRFSVFVLGENFENNAKPVVEVCNPGDGSEKGEHGDLIANIKKLKQQYESKYIEKIMNAYPKEFIGIKPANASPIFEMLQLISVNSLSDKSMQGEKKLFIVSDMLQNTPHFSMYSGKELSFKAFEASEYGLKQALQLKNVSIEINLILTQPQLQRTSAFSSFWGAYFAKAGHSDITIKPLGY